MTNQTPAPHPSAALDNDQATNRQFAIAQTIDIICDNETWMLTTCGSDRVIHSCPMLNVNQTLEGELFMFANEEDHVVRRLRENPQVNVTISEPAKGRYASITGSAKRSTDLKKMELLWDDRCSKWFGQKKPEASNVLIVIDVEDVEYWDVTESVISRIGDYFRSMAGGAPSAADIEHEKVDWDESSMASGTTNSTKFGVGGDQ